MRQASGLRARVPCSATGIAAAPELRGKKGLTTSSCLLSWDWLTALLLVAAFPMGICAWLVYPLHSRHSLFLLRDSVSLTHLESGKTLASTQTKG